MCIRDSFNDGRLNAGAQIAYSLRVIQNPRMIAEIISHGGFQAAEAEIVTRVVKQRPREEMCIRDRALVPAINQQWMAPDEIRRNAGFDGRDARATNLKC